MSIESLNPRPCGHPRQGRRRFGDGTGVPVSIRVHADTLVRAARTSPRVRKTMSQSASMRTPSSGQDAKVFGDIVKSQSASMRTPSSGECLQSEGNPRGSQSASMRTPSSGQRGSSAGEVWAESQSASMRTPSSGLFFRVHSYERGGVSIRVHADTLVRAMIS